MKVKTTGAKTRVLANISALASGRRACASSLTPAVCALADVWACGVLLFVMLLGAFPFEHDPASAADEQRAFNEVHFEQIRIHWTENPRNKDIVKHMSPECVDLLDRIFQLNESKRIKISDIRQHAWFTAPMSPKYASAMQAITSEQEGLLQLLEKSKVRCSFLVRNAPVSTDYLDTIGTAPAHHASGGLQR